FALSSAVCLASAPCSAVRSPSRLVAFSLSTRTCCTSRAAASTTLSTRSRTRATCSLLILAAASCAAFTHNQLSPRAAGGETSSNSFHANVFVSMANLLSGDAGRSGCGSGTAEDAVEDTRQERQRPHGSRILPVLRIELHVTVAADVARPAEPSDERAQN